MKKMVYVLIFAVLMFSVTVFADEFSNSAEIDYGYNGDYDKTTTPGEETSNKFDDSDSFYDESYDETVDDSYYGDEELEPIDNRGIYNNDNGDNEWDEYSDRNTNGITVYVNNKKINFDVQPILINSRTMVPVRAIFEALGATVTWNDKTETAKGVLGDTTVGIKINENYILKNGEKITIDSPAIIIDGRTLVPVRAIAESFDCIVNWYDETQVVEILK